MLEAAAMADDEQSHTTLYGGASPIFDVPEFPPLRRVVPLPKRRRIIDATPNILPKSIQAERERQSQTTPDELAHTLSTSMALHSYYMPLFNGAPSALFKNDDIDARHVDPTDLTPHAGDDGYADGRDNGDRDDGDYTDHLMQPGNTKKRKVPVTAHSRAGDDTLGILDGEEDLFADRAFLPDRGEAAAVEVVPPAPPPSAVTAKKGRFSRATQVGLQHKEMLKSRKRQLAAVLGALSHGDTLALDQALSSSYPFTKSVQHKKEQDAGGPPIRLSRRLARRNARALIVTSQGLPALPTNDIAKIPDCTFTFEYDSPTSERLRATKEEVAFLHGRFEAELSRQAARAAEAARQAALVVSQMQKSKRNDRSQQRARIAGQFPGGAASESAPTNSEKAVLTSKSKAKKKKRSALANASNPHHLRNYVPSRLPHSGPLHSAQAAINAQNHLSPPPLRFLSAELPPRKKSAVTASPLASLTSPEDEWICAFCEYSLFYGDEHSYRRTIRQRKKILSRRRRAMERASAAAAGRKKGVASPDKEDSVGDDQTDAFDVPSPEVQTTSKHAKLREEQDRDRDKDGEHGAY